MFALNSLNPQQPGAEFDSMSADLCNWDFLQDLDFAADLETDNNAISQIAAPDSSSHERQKERNRKAQQRARQKKKVRTIRHYQPCKRRPRVRLAAPDFPCVPGTVAKYRVPACRDDQPASRPQVEAETARSTKSLAGARCCQ